VTWVKHVLVCANVRRDSLTKRHGGHGLAYAYVASMLATFASRVAFAGLQMHFFPAPGDGRVERRLWEATACWAIVYALPASWFLYVCGPKPPARVARAAMYLAAALNKYRQVRRAAKATANVERVVARVAIVACVGAASTLSRAVTDQWVTGRRGRRRRGVAPGSGSRREGGGGERGIRRVGDGGGERGAGARARGLERDGVRGAGREVAVRARGVGRGDDREADRAGRADGGLSGEVRGEGESVGDAVEGEAARGGEEGENDVRRNRARLEEINETPSGR
jgi:hypothetical protein